MKGILINYHQVTKNITRLDGDYYIMMHRKEIS